MSPTAYRPRLNHVAITVDPLVLNDRGRADVLSFYGEVFGWQEGDNTGEAGNPLILYTGSFGQFIYLLPADPHLVAPALDHFGLQVSEVADIEEPVGKAKAYQCRDNRVDIIDVHARVLPRGPVSYTLTSAYIGFLLPLMVELQHIERHGPAGE